MTIDAKAHRVIHRALRDRHLGQVAVAHRAIDSGSNMRSVIESHMGFFVKSVNPLPRHVFAALRVISQHLNALIVGIADRFVATHAKVNAWNAGARPGLHSDVTFLTLDADFID